uniref:Uncharacterized protein n=1 Tax=Trichogramma kaykai TaxID=54128 RepID=A0ABD2W5P1_9HYME
MCVSTARSRLPAIPSLYDLGYISNFEANIMQDSKIVILIILSVFVTTVEIDSKKFASIQVYTASSNIYESLYTSILGVRELQADSYRAPYPIRGIAEKGTFVLCRGDLKFTITISVNDVYTSSSTDILTGVRSSIHVQLCLIDDFFARVTSYAYKKQ